MATKQVTTQMLEAAMDAQDVAAFWPHWVADRESALAWARRFAEIVFELDALQFNPSANAKVMALLSEAARISGAAETWDKGSQTLIYAVMIPWEDVEELVILTWSLQDELQWFVDVKPREIGKTPPPPPPVERPSPRREREVPVRVGNYEVGLKKTGAGAYDVVLGKKTTAWTITHNPAVSRNIQWEAREDGDPLPTFQGYTRAEVLGRVAALLASRYQAPAPRTIGIVGCGRDKIDTGDARVPARDLYTGQLFRSALRHSEQNHDLTFIASALFGVITPDAPVFTYDKKLTPRDASQWAFHAWQKLAPYELQAGDAIYIYAGKVYAEALALSPYRNRDVSIFLPLEGLQVGERLRWFKERR